MTFTVEGTVTIDGKQAKLSIKGIDDAFDKASDSADKFKTSGNNAAKTGAKVAGANKQAAGSVANLTAQFNDIGVMLAAGQNPLQLAIQQGTQITQVFGGAGAAQAGSMLTKALVSMISPLNLITIGGIAAGAAMVQWLSSSTSGAQDLDKVLTEVEQTMSDYFELVSKSNELAGDGFKKARSELARTSQAYRDLIAIAKIDAFDNIEELNAALVSSVLSASYLKTEMGDVGDLLNLETVLRGNITAWKANRQEIAGFIELLENFENAVGIDAQYQAALRLRDAFKQTVDVNGDLTDEQLKFWRSLSQSIQKMELLGAHAKEVRKATQGVTQAAYASAKGFASAIGPVDILIGKVGALATNAWSYANAMAREHQAYKTTVGRGRGADPRQFGGSASDIQQNDPAAQLAYTPGGTAGVPKLKFGKKSRGGGAAARAAKREQKAIDDLIASLKTQIDVIKETDPVQKEMIENRRVLENATKAERKAVEKLITTRNKEEAAIERATELSDFFAEATESALDSLVDRGNEGISVIDSLGDALKKAALQAALLGTGHLAGLFGTGDNGGLFGILTTAITGEPFEKKADGGMIYGSGGPRDDLVNVKASPGEFFVNAQATAANRGVLEYINAGGRIEGFANGGAVGSAPFVPGPARAGQDGRITLQILPSDLFQVVMQETAENVTVQGIDQYRSNVLPGDVDQISSDPTRIG